MKNYSAVGIQCPFCDTPFKTSLYAWLRGATKSCGCMTNKWQNKSRIKHGHSVEQKHSLTYNSWSMMIQRCTNPNYTQYKDYGGRGITVCQAWRWFPYFLTDMGVRPIGKTLDRINNEGNYEPENCRWSTPKEQQTNRR